MKENLITRKELMKTLQVSSTVISELINQGLPNINKKYFNIDQVVKWRNEKSDKMLSQLIIGDTYTNEEIVGFFLCSPQGGMRRSHRTNTLVLFADYTGKNIYKDRWNNGILQYTGMGLTGDQTLEGNQNKILAYSNENYVQVHLFETHVSRKHVYQGKVMLMDEPYQVLEFDITNRKRLVYKFPITKI